MNDAWLDGASWRALERAYAVAGEARKAWARRRPKRAVDPDDEALRAALDRHGYTAAKPHAEALLARNQLTPSVIAYLYATGQGERAPRAVPEPYALDADALATWLAEHPRALLRAPQLHLLRVGAERARDQRAAAASFNRYLRATALPRVELAAPSSRFLDDVWFPAPPRAPGGPLVSILVAAYRARATIAYAIDSLLAQTYPDVEILVCDDASDDGTADLLATRYARVPRVRRFASTANQGPYNVRNALLPHARGTLITFHDADDLALPTRIATQVRRLRATGAAASFTTLLRVAPDGRFGFTRDGHAARLAMVTMMCERALLDELGGFRAARFGADLDAYERLRDRRAPIDITRAPQLLAAAGGLTRAGGTESLDDGFRAPARRAYGDLLHARAIGTLADAELPRALQALGNWAEPAAITSRT